MIRVYLSESKYQDFRRWQKENCSSATPPPVNLKRKRKRVSEQVAPHVSIGRLQLPLRLFGTHKGKYMEVTLWWIDNEDGADRLGNKRSNTIVQVTLVPDSMRHLLGKFVATVTKSVNLLFDNTQSGWTAWKVKDVKPNLPLQRFRRKYGGPGFRNHPLLTTMHRDYLMSLCHDREKSYTNSICQVNNMIETVDKRLVIKWLDTTFDTRQEGEVHPASPNPLDRESPSILLPDPLCSFVGKQQTSQ